MATGIAVACVALSGTPAFAGGVRSQEWWLHKLHVTRAWQSTHAGGVTVAVLDTGVDPNQPDLAGSVIVGPDYTNSGRVLSGPFWGIHGTAMASIIAGHGHGTGQAAGMMGIAPAATILSVRVTLEADDPMLADANIAAGLPDAIAHGIRYAVRHGASVIDLPLDPVTATGAAGAGGSPSERAAVDYALAHRVVLVAPAGDDTVGTDPVNFPAAYPGVISVGAFNSTFTKASFSSAQPYVTLTAAGDGIVAASPPNGYAQISSTSAASAVAAGIVALIRAQFPVLSPAQVTKALTQSTVYRPSGGQNDGSGAGTVDAARALAAAASMVEAVPTSGASAGAGTPPAQVPPAPPVVHAKSRNLRSTLLLDAGIALAVFLLLAVPILLYGRMRRRRARAARLAEVRAAAQVPVRRPKQTVSAATSQDDDVPSSLSPGFPAATSSIATPSSTAAGPRARSEDNGFPGSAFPAAGQQPGAGSPPVPGSAAARAIGSHRMGLTRTPKISGSPPWEPAHEPAGEVPWGRTPSPAAPPSSAAPSTTAAPSSAAAPPSSAAPSSAAPSPSASPPWPAAPPVSAVPPSSPAPPASASPPWPAAPPVGGAPTAAGHGPGNGLVPGAQRPAAPAPQPPVPDLSPWDAIAQEAWPGGPSASKPPAASPPEGAGSNGSRGRKRGSGGDAPEEQDPADLSRPIYTWNPGASTESFPAFPPGEQGKS